MKMLHCVSPLLNAPKHTFFRVTIVKYMPDGAQQRVDARVCATISNMYPTARERENLFI